VQPTGVLNPLVGYGGLVRSASYSLPAVSTVAPTYVAPTVSSVVAPTYTTGYTGGLVTGGYGYGGVVGGYGGIARSASYSLGAVAPVSYATGIARTASYSLGSVVAPTYTTGAVLL